MVLKRRSAAFKDLPSGQVFGRSYDYIYRLLDFSTGGVRTARGARKKKLRKPQSLPARTIPLPDHVSTEPRESWRSSFALECPHLQTLLDFQCSISYS
jgi:hypothetical protein